jgi:hypothetical protein
LENLCTADGPSLEFIYRSFHISRPIIEAMPTGLYSTVSIQDTHLTLYLPFHPIELSGFTQPPAQWEQSPFMRDKDGRYVKLYTNLLPVSIC